MPECPVQCPKVRQQLRESGLISKGERLSDIISKLERIEIRQAIKAKAKALDGESVLYAKLDDDQDIEGLISDSVLGRIDDYEADKAVPYKVEEELLAPTDISAAKARIDKDLILLDKKDVSDRSRIRDSETSPIEIKEDFTQVTKVTMPAYIEEQAMATMTSQELYVTLPHSACQETCPLRRTIRKLEERQRIVDHYLLTKGFHYFDDVCTCSLSCILHSLKRDCFVRSILTSATLFLIGLKLCSELKAWYLPIRVSS